MAINDTVLRLNDDGSCEHAQLKGYPTVSGDGVTSTVDPLTGAVNYSIVDNTVTYTWAETNPNDGDGIIEWTVTGTEQPSGAVVSTQIVTLPEESDGIHFSGQPTYDAVTGIITFPTVKDADESPATPVTLDVADDECAEFSAPLSDYNSTRINGCDLNGKGSIPICKLVENKRYSVGGLGSPRSYTSTSAVGDIISLGEIEVELKCDQLARLTGRLEVQWKTLNSTGNSFAVMQYSVDGVTAATPPFTNGASSHPASDPDQTATDATQAIFSEPFNLTAGVHTLAVFAELGRNEMGVGDYLSFTEYQWGFDYVEVLI